MCYFLSQPPKKPDPKGKVKPGDKAKKKEGSGGGKAKKKVSNSIVESNPSF